MLKRNFEALIYTLHVQVHRFLLYITRTLQYLRQHTILKHYAFCLTYIIFLTIFRYAVFFKSNHEFRTMMVDSRLGLYYHRTDKAGDVYRFGIGQFYEYVTINQVYKNRKFIIEKNLHYIFNVTCEILFKCIIYCIIITSVSYAILLTLTLLGFIPVYVFFCLLIAIMAKNALTFISSFRIVNDSISKFPINVFINLLQVFLPYISYFILFPFFSIQLNLHTFVLNALVINIISSFLYYLNMCRLFGRFVYPVKIKIQANWFKDIYYILHMLLKNMINNMFVDIFLMFALHNISDDMRLQLLYLMTAGIRNVSGILETPLDWTNRVFINKYQNTKDFISNSFIVLTSFIIIIITMLAFLIKYNVYNNMMVIKFTDNIYYLYTFIITVMVIYSRLWETVVLAQKRDIYPTLYLLSGITAYCTTAYILIHVYNYPCLDSLIYGYAVNWLLQYLLFITRGFYLLKINYIYLLLEFMKYISVVVIIRIIYYVVV